MGCGTGCAGRHGGAPARPYVGGIAHTRRRSCLKCLSFSFSLQGSLLFVGFDITKAWQGRWVMGIEEAYFSMSVHSFQCVVG